MSIIFHGAHPLSQEGQDLIHIWRVSAASGVDCPLMTGFSRESVDNDMNQEVVCSIGMQFLESTTMVLDHLLEISEICMILLYLYRIVEDIFSI